MGNWSADENVTSTSPPIEPYFLQTLRNYHVDNFLIVLVVVNAVVAILACLSNTTVAYTIARTPSLRTPSNLLILGLSISDLACSSIVQPSFCAYKYFEFKRHVSFYQTFRSLYTSSVTVLAVTSFLILTAVTADRFLAIRLHLRYNELVTNKRYTTLLIVVAILGVLTCISRLVPSFFSVLTSLISVCALLANAFFLVKIFRAIRRHSTQIQSQQQSTQQTLDIPRYKKSFRTIQYVIGAFMLCYMPWLVVQIVYFITKISTLEMRCVYSVGESLVMFNGILNPIIYCWKISSLRCAVIAALRNAWCSREELRTTRISGVHRMVQLEMSKSPACVVQPLQH